MGMLTLQQKVVHSENEIINNQSTPKLPDLVTKEKKEKKDTMSHEDKKLGFC